MNIDETKAYLQRIYKLNCKINELIEKKRSYRELSEKITQSFDGCGGSGKGNKDKISGLSARIIDIEYEITDKIDELVDLKQETEDQIDMLPNEMERMILVLRHIRFLEFSEIARKTSYHVRTVHKIYKKALMHLSMILSESDKVGKERPDRELSL